MPAHHTTFSSTRTHSTMATHLTHKSVMWGCGLKWPAEWNQDMKIKYLIVASPFRLNHCWSIYLQISIVAKQLPGGVLTTFPSHIHPGYNILYVYMEELSMDVGISHSHSPIPIPMIIPLIRSCSVRSIPTMWQWRGDCAELALSSCSLVSIWSRAYWPSHVSEFNVCWVYWAKFWHTLQSAGCQ